MMKSKSVEYFIGRRGKSPILIFLFNSDWFGAVNGGVKAQSSYSIQPRDQISDFSL